MKNAAPRNAYTKHTEELEGESGKMGDQRPSPRACDPDRDYEKKKGTKNEN